MPQVPYPVYRVGVRELYADAISEKIAKVFVTTARWCLRLKMGSLRIQRKLPLSQRATGSAVWGFTFRR